MRTLGSALGLKLGSALLAAALIGCGDLDDTDNTGSEPPADATNGAADGGGDGGDFGGTVVDNARAFNTGGGTPAPAQNNPPAPNNAGQPPAQQNIPLEDSKVVDMRVEMAKNANLKVVENKAQGQDPISFAASAYVTLSTQAQALAFQRELQLQKELNGGQPISYDQFMTSVRQMKVDFNKLPPYRMYGYDTQNGQIVILEDAAKKKQLYEEKGIPLDE
jgi:hypothetical protein